MLGTSVPRGSQKYYTEQRDRIELFFAYNYKDITLITFTGTSTTPMGSLDFEGYFNGDKEINV